MFVSAGCARFLESRLTKDTGLFRLLAAHTTRNQRSLRCKGIANRPSEDKMFGKYLTVLVVSICGPANCRPHTREDKLNCHEKPSPRCRRAFAVRDPGICPTH